MDTQQFDEKTQSLTTQIEELSKITEQIQQEFLQSTQTFLAQWIRSRVENAVTRKSEVSKKLGVEGLRKLKSELNQMVDDVPQLVTKHLNVDSLWAHRFKLPIDTNKEYGRYHFYGSGPDDLNTAVRILMGYAGTLLMKYGYAEKGNRDEWDMLRQDGSQNLIYKYAVHLSPDMRSKLDTYAGLYDKLITLIGELERVKEEKASYEAKNLWDQA